MTGMCLILFKTEFVLCFLYCTGNTQEPIRIVPNNYSSTIVPTQINEVTQKDFVKSKH